MEEHPLLKRSENLIRDGYHGLKGQKTFSRDVKTVKSSLLPTAKIQARRPLGSRENVERSVGKKLACPNSLIPATKNLEIDTKLAKRLGRTLLSAPAQKKTDTTENSIPVDKEIHLLSLWPSLPPDVIDIDLEDKDNPQMLSIYVSDLYAYLYVLERKQRIQKEYLSRSVHCKGTEVTSQMRLILIDWIVQVHLKYDLLQETLYLTIAFLDYFLQNNVVMKDKLQLVGVAALFVASKYEERYGVLASDLVTISDHGFSVEDILYMERQMLDTLNFNLGKPFPLNFLRRFSKAGRVRPKEHHLAKYVMELSLSMYSLVHILPSQLAAASLCLSLCILNNELCHDLDVCSVWSPTLQHYSLYTYLHLRPVIARLCSQLILESNSSKKYRTITKKYMSSSASGISALPSLQGSYVKAMAGKVAEFCD